MAKAGRSKAMTSTAGASNGRRLGAREATQPETVVAAVVTCAFLIGGWMLPLAALFQRAFFPAGFAPGSGVSAVTSVSTALGGNVTSTSAAVAGAAASLPSIGFAAVFADPLVLAIVRGTAWQALISTIISAAIGLGLGLWVGNLSWRRAPGAAAARFFLRLPYTIPTVVVGVTGVVWLGRSGLLGQWGWQTDWLFTLKAVIGAHVFLNAPWVALGVCEAREQLPVAPWEAARTLGADARTRFRTLLWPYISSAFAQRCIQVYSLCAMSFVLVLLLGGGPPVETLETAIYGRIRYQSLDLTGALACALWQLLITLGPWFLILFFRRRARTLPAGRGPAARPGDRRQSAVAAAACAAFVIPYAALLGPAFWRVCAHLVSDLDARAEVLHSLWLSIGLAAGASLGAVLFAASAVVWASALQRQGRHGRGAILQVLMSVPNGISALVLGLGFWLAYSRWVDPFEGSVTSMISLQAILFSPIVFRTLWPLAERSQTAALEAARTLGVGRLGAWRVVEWPRFRGPLAGVAGLVAGAALGEVAAVSLFYSENLIPLPLLLTRWMAQYHFEEAQAVSVLLLGLAAFTLLISEKRA